ncbi:MAG: outer membrane beta-barrel domain-containing protein [Anaerolineales bacterium]|nr:outer membrane beta-barrel domain-containing protein [Anaerolineales bacterium]
MKAGKKGRQAIFHHSACLPFASLQRLVLLAQRYPIRLFSKSRKGNNKTQQYKGGRTMKAMYRAALMVAAFVFLLPLSARSEIKAGSFEVSPFVGYNFFENSQNLKDRPVFGGRLGYNFTRHLGIEGAVEFINSRVDDKAKTGGKEGQFRSPMDGVDLTFYHIDAVYHFIPDGKFNPFVVAGFGGAHYSPTISTRNMAAFNVGVGAKYSVTDNIALRVDLKDYMVTEIFHETYHNIGATIGITFAFGGKAKPAPAKVAKYEPIPEFKPEPKPEPLPTPPPPPPPEPRVEEKVVIMASEPMVEEKVMVAAAEPKIIILAFEDVHFDFDKSTLKPEAQTILKRNVQMLKDNPKTQIRIAGYTSASGTEVYNQKLSEGRANAVQEYLINEGVITRDRLSTIGYGETNPAMYEAAPKELYSAAAKANMRVLFEIIVQ